MKTRNQDNKLTTRHISNEGFAEWISIGGPAIKGRIIFNIDSINIIVISYYFFIFSCFRD